MSIVCRLFAVLGLLFLGLPSKSLAEPAILVADQVFVEADKQLVASGNVEAFIDGTRLRANSIIYDQTTDTVRLEGPIRITEADGTIFLAEEAELDQELLNGLLLGARIVLNDQLQLAANEAHRIDGRFTQMNRVAVSSCQVCGRNQTPLWQIRANKIIHDQQEKQIYFDRAQFRILDVPIVTIPKLRMPDPTLKRARGLLAPELTSSSLLGIGFKIPYFIPIGDHQDLTLTPHIESKAQSLEWRYRRAFARGDIEFNGAISRDELREGVLRSYINGTGRFTLRNDINLRYNITLTSDSTYLANHDINRSARLRNDIAATRTKQNSLLEAELIHWNSLRVSGLEDNQPHIAGDVRYERRYFPNRIGGELRVEAELHGHLRYGDISVDGNDTGGETDGRDMARLNMELSWRDRWTLPGGLRAGLSTHLWLDRFETRHDSTSARSASYATPGISAELRYPLVRRGANGSRTLIEPILQYGWTGGERPVHANDESLRPEFDDGNLLSLTHFPGQDRRDSGHQVAAGLRFNHKAPAGWETSFNIGKIWQDAADADFTNASGLNSETSDLLITGHFENDSGIAVGARGLLGGDLQFTHAEAFASYSRKNLSLNASYLLLEADPAVERLTTTTEWAVGGTYRFAKHWTGTASVRYDLSGDRLDRVGLGLQYQNECIAAKFGATQRFGRTASAAPTTTYDLSIDLLGFGSGSSNKEYHRTCSY